MSLEIQKISTFIQGTIRSNYRTASRFTIGCGAICAFAATEAALRVINDIWQICSYKQIMPHRVQQLNTHLLEAAVLGFGAFNALSKSAIVIALLFTIHAVFKDREDDDYLTIKFLNRSFIIMMDKVVIPAIKTIRYTVLDIRKLIPH